MRIDPDRLRALIEELYQPMVFQKCGELGIKTLNNLTTNIRIIYSHFSPEHFHGTITIFQTLKETDIDLGKEPVSIREIDNLATQCNKTFAIHVTNEGLYNLYNEIVPDPIELSKTAIVYVHNEGKEYIYSGEEYREIYKLHHTHSSCFSIPMFYELRDALESYSTSMIRHSSCLIFNDVWYDAKRIYFKHAQEAVMRRSLTQYLKSCLRGDCEVRPEQIVDESHPVDIKVTWHLANRLALIEIKWLGTPCEENSVGSPYTEYRALEGAKQLTDYMDANKSQAPYHTSRGYLVVIDGRRKGISSFKTNLTREKGNHYSTKEIEYNPKYHELRDDFEVPIRMFAEPVCN